MKIPSIESGVPAADDYRPPVPLITIHLPLNRINRSCRWSLYLENLSDEERVAKATKMIEVIKESGT